MPAWGGPCIPPGCLAAFAARCRLLCGHGRWRRRTLALNPKTWPYRVQEVVSALPTHIKVVDLSADFRLRDVATYAEW